MINDIDTALSDRNKIYKLSITSRNEDDTTTEYTSSFFNDYSNYITLMSIFTSNTISLLTAIFAINYYCDLQVNNSILKFCFSLYFVVLIITSISIVIVGYMTMVTKLCPRKSRVISRSNKDSQNNNDNKNSGGYGQKMINSEKQSLDASLDDQTFSKLLSPPIVDYGNGINFNLNDLPVNGNAHNMKFAAQMTPGSSVLSTEDMNIPSIGIRDELFLANAVDSIASQQRSENPMNNIIVSSYIVGNNHYDNIHNNKQNNNYKGTGNINIGNVSNLLVADGAFDQQPPQLHDRRRLETNDTQTTSFDGDADDGGIALLTLDGMPPMDNINNVHNINSSNNNHRLMANRILIDAQARSSSSSSSRAATVINNLNSNVHVDAVVDGVVAIQSEIVTNVNYMIEHTGTQEIQVQTANGIIDGNNNNHSSAFDPFCDITSWCSCLYCNFEKCFTRFETIFDLLL